MPRVNAPSLGLVWRGLWWRRGLNVAVFAVALVTTAAAALGPLYARAAGESTLDDHLTEATWRAGIHAQAFLDISDNTYYARLRRLVLQPKHLRGYDRTVHGLRTIGETGISFPNGITGNVQAQIAWRQGACAHLELVRGRCPTRPGEAVASERTAETGLGWHPGTKIVARLSSSQTDTEVSLPLRIVGTYRPADRADPFWFGHDYFNAQEIAGQPPIVDTLFVAQQTFRSLRSITFVDADFDYPLTANQVRLANVATERAAVRRLIDGHMGELLISVHSGLFGVLDAAAHDRHLVDVGTLLVILQLGLLAWLVLFQVIADSAEARANEVAMAKLRGHSPLRAVRFGLAEPLTLLLLAIPAGLVAAWALTHAFAASVLVPGVPVVVTVAPVLAALAAFAGGLVAALLASYRVVTRSVLEQWRRTTRRPTRGWLGIAADVVLAAAAVAGLVALYAGHRSGSTDDTAALLAPGLLVFAVALVGVRLLPPACRRLARASRATSRIATFLASRQVARRPVGLRLAVLLAVAAGLATFAVAGETVTTANRTARAGAELGAARVVAVQFSGGLDPVAAARIADPRGTWAMAAGRWLPDDGSLVAEPVIGIDPGRLPAVGRPVSGGLTPATLTAAVSGRPIVAIHFATTQLRVHLTATGLRGDTPPTLQVNLRTAIEPFLNVDGQAIRDGTADYLVRVPCRAGCTLRGLTWDRPIQAVRPMSGTITASDIEIVSRHGWRPLPLHFAGAKDWRAAAPQGQAYDRVTLLRHAVRDQFGNRNGGYGGIIYGSAPTVLPAVATNSTPMHRSTGTVVDGIGVTAAFRVVHRVRLLPSVLNFGVAMNAEYLEAELPEFRNDASWQIWLGPHAPPDALARLKATGLQIESVRTENERIAVLARQGPALALLLLLVCAIAGAALATAGTAIAISASRRRRSYEIAALHAVGVSRPALLRAGVLEQLLLLGAAVLLGVPAGIVAARLAMPVIPEFADHTPVVLHYTPQWFPTFAFVCALVALLALAAVAGARAPMRQAVPARLREAGA